MTTSDFSRRDFLRRTGQTTLTGLAAPWLLNLTAMGEAAAFSATDYKALVCVFLFGGNDYANTVVTYDDASYAKYASIRAAGSGGTTGMVLDKAAGAGITARIKVLANLKLDEKRLPQDGRFKKEEKNDFNTKGKVNELPKYILRRQLNC